MQAENNLEQSKLKLDIAQQEYDNLVETQSITSGNVSDKETTLEKAKIDIQNYIIEGGKIIDQLDGIFGSSDKYKLYEPNLKAFIAAQSAD
ncbi:MAG: hypothetical protein WCP92_05905 [bacterium]